MLDKKTTKAKLLKKISENVEIMVSELFNIRYKKIQKIFDQGTITRTLTEEEKKIYGGVLSVTEAGQNFYENILQGRFPSYNKESKRTMMVLRFLQKTPALVGSNMKTYGPFEVEDIATLPTENARILVAKKFAIEVNIC